MSILNFLAQQSQFQLPPGEPLTYSRITNFLDATAMFLYTAGVTLAVITLVVSGIMYFWAKSDTEAKNAKGWFRNGIIGVVIILAIGVIINTIVFLLQGRSGSITPGSGQQSGQQSQIADCRLTAVLVDETLVRRDERINITIVPEDYRNCVGKTMTKYLCNNQNCRQPTTDVFTQSGSTQNHQTWWSGNIADESFYFRVDVDGSSTRSADIRFTQP